MPALPHLELDLPSPRSGKGQTLPSGGRSTNDRSRTVSGSPSVESRASAERREQTSTPTPLIAAVFYQLRVIVRTCGVGNFQNLHGQAVGAFNFLTMLYRSPRCRM